MNFDVLVQEVTTEMLWPYSWAWCRMGAGGAGGAGSVGGAGGEEGEAEPAAPLCRSPGAAAAATELLLALVQGCVPNMAELAHLLQLMFYGGTCPLSYYLTAVIANLSVQLV